MKIALIKKNYDPRGGGAERYAAAICARLAQRGHRILIFSESFKNSSETDAEMIRVPRSSFAGFSRTINFHRAVRKAISKHSFDISYSLSRTYPSDAFRVSEQIHTEWMKTGYPAWQRLNPRHREILGLEKKIYSTDNTRAVVTNSMMIKKQISANFAYPEERIHFIGNGVDRARFSPPAGEHEIREIRARLAIPEGKFVLLFPAANFKIKGAKAILDTLLLIPGEIRGRMMLIALGGNLDSRGMQAFRRNGLDGIVRFDGRRENMRDYYCASDLLFFPSRYEPFANVCLEACACGLPILTTATNGSNEVIEHNSGGFVAPSPDSTELMARHIVEFFNMPQENRKDFSRNAIRGAARYDWDEHIARLEKLFEQIAAEKKKSGL